MADKPAAQWHQNALHALLEVTPRVACDPQHTTLFWLDLRGMNAWLWHRANQQQPFSVSTALDTWATALASAIGDLFEGPIVSCIGFERWSLWALMCEATYPANGLWVQWGHHALWRPHNNIEEQRFVSLGAGNLTSHEERTASEKVSLSKLPLSLAAIEQAQCLRILYLADLREISLASVSSRLGAELMAWKSAMSATDLPLKMHHCQKVSHVSLEFEEPTNLASHVLFAVKRILPQLVNQAECQYKKISVLHIIMVFEAEAKLINKPSPVTQERRLSFAKPTSDQAVIMRLVQLYLNDLKLPRAVEKIVLEGAAVEVEVQQLSLWDEHQERQNESIEQAIAHIRAAFGENSVVVAELIPSLVPDKSFLWKKEFSLKKKKNGFSSKKVFPLVRRVFNEPKPWVFDRGISKNKIIQTAANSDGDALFGQDKSYQGPFVFSGHWWETPHDYDYFYVKKEDDVWLWVSFDRRRRCWQWRGVVD